MVENSRRSGMDASLSVISQVGNQSSNFSSGRQGSTLHEVKTKSGKSVLCSSSCGCYGSARVCAVCLARKNERAPRAGTPGFRAPEVLLRHPKQTTAVDMWSAGVMLLCLLSGKYPFFRAVDDTLSLAEIATILGTKVMKKAAATLEKLFTCSEEKPTLDLTKICETMLAGAKNGITTSSCDGKSIFDFKCDRCKQKYDCVCLLSSINARTSNGSGIYSPNSFNIGDKSLSQTASKLSQMCFNDGNACNSSGEQMYPTYAYDLLSRLLDPNPATRISADDALKHPFVLPYAQ